MKFTVKFTKDYANKKKGDILTINSMIAASLIGKHKVAKMYKEKKEKNPKLEK